ncbi:MAG TPA: YncE family protein [Acidimicrobiales bacterium]|nr:YncE family protein [Acidimicrobiales bacterium]
MTFEPNPEEPTTRAPRRRRATLAGGAALTAAAVAAAIALAVAPGGRAPTRVGSTAGRVTSATCSGPTGAAYVAEPGYQAFGAIDTSDCSLVQTYNVDDAPVPGFPDDLNYGGTDEGEALAGNLLFFAVTGQSNVAVIDTQTLDPSNYSPPEKLIPVGLFPQAVAVRPGGKQAWVADTGPQTSPDSPSGISVISTASRRVTAKLPLAGQPNFLAFSPSGDRAYVTTNDGLAVYDTASERLVTTVTGLGQPHGVAVSPDGNLVYVAESSRNRLAVIDAATDRVVGTVKVGDLPWQVAVSKDGRTVYVADPDSDAVSMVSASTRKLVHTISVTGGPDTLALTPDGSELWVGDMTSGYVTVLDAGTGALVGDVNLGGSEPQSGDGLEPTDIVLTTTPTPSGS